MYYFRFSQERWSEFQNWNIWFTSDCQHIVTISQWFLDVSKMNISFGVPLHKLNCATWKAKMIETIANFFNFRKALKDSFFFKIMCGIL